eukprot:529032_1
MAGFDYKQDDKNSPKITNYYCIPLCLKNRLKRNCRINIIDDYKLINPNIYSLFNKYNHLFFDNKLKTVCVKWDYSEKINAGLCTNISNFCTISLSVQLLQFRPTKDLIETLLHEMIHSYLFIKQLHHKEKTHHGARFLTIMNVINYICNIGNIKKHLNNKYKLNIWIRHNYLSELDAMKSHKWQCNQCKQIIFRPYCRAPGPHEKWWNKHLLQCGGIYKVIELNNKKRLSNDEWEMKKKLKRKEKEKQKQLKKQERDNKIEMYNNNEIQSNNDNNNNKDNR